MGWIGVDLDGTLADMSKPPIPGTNIGPPIDRMVQRIRKWIAEGKEVRIVTARVGWNRDQVPMILWYLKACGVTDKELVIQANKDYDMEELWDDRVVQVITNTGERADGLKD